eukprot:SAG11_NODE_333_length_10574_cov_7.889451_8_plen_271_part_00
MLATELQLYHEDAVLSEDYDVEQWSAAKPMLVRGLAASPTAPAFIGLFGIFNMSAKPLFQLRSAAALAMRMIGASYMMRLKPHFSWYGLQQQPPDAAEQAVAQTLRWYQTVRARLFTKGQRAASTVAAVVSRPAINYRGAVLEQSDWSLEIGGDWLVTTAQSLGAPSVIVSAANLAPATMAEQFGPWLQVILLQNTTVLPRPAAEAVARFAEGGGTVISSADSGSLDELGRALPLAERRLPTQPGGWGEGRLIGSNRRTNSGIVAGAGRG